MAPRCPVIVSPELLCSTLIFIRNTANSLAMTAGCAYSHDVSSELFEDLSGGEWQCSREAFGDTDLCIFHAAPELVEPEAVSQQLQQAIETKEGPVRLIGAHLGALSLDYHILAGPSNHPIDLREATVEGDVSMQNATINRPLQLENVIFEGAVDFGETTFSRRVDFGESDFEDDVSFRMADFESWLDIRDVDFHAPVYARIARFRHGIYAIGATFHAAADFLNTRFDDVANFYRTTFERGAVFNSSTFDGNAQFIEATFDAPAVRLESETGSPRSRRERLEGVALSMNGVTCHRDLRVTDAELAGDIVFTDSELGRDIEAEGLDVMVNQITVDCGGSAVISGHVDASGDNIMYDMTGATLGEFQVSGITSFSNFRFDGTVFEGFDFGSYIHELAADDWRLHARNQESEPERIENLYLRAKNGAKDIGETRAAAEFFIKEMDYRRAGHWLHATKGSSIRERARALGSWLSNTTLQITCGYGERPFRPVLFSFATIVLFAGLYGVLNPPLAYPKPQGYLIFSTLNFVSIILGLPEVGGSIVNFLIAVEGFVGAFVIALFVFTLTRSISR